MKVGQPPMKTVNMWSTTEIVWKVVILAGMLMIFLTSNNTHLKVKIPSRYHVHIYTKMRIFNARDPLITL